MVLFWVHHFPLFHNVPKSPFVGYSINILILSEIPISMSVMIETSCGHAWVLEKILPQLRDVSQADPTCFTLFVFDSRMSTVSFLSIVLPSIGLIGPIVI